jgi:hypothetical protein
MPLNELITNFAQKIATYGHSIRMENIGALEDTIEYSKELCSIHGELTKAGIHSNLLDIAQAMIASCKAMDTVTLADILEYELLDKLEEILNEL